VEQQLRRSKHAYINARLRGLLLDDYIIFYQLLKDGIEVLRVLRGDRDLEALFEVESSD